MLPFLDAASIVRGRLTDARTIVLDEPVEGVETNVEVVLREAVAVRLDETGESIVAVVRRVDLENAAHDVEVEVMRDSGASGNPTEDSSFVLARRVGATIPAGPPVDEDAPPSR